MDKERWEQLMGSFESELDDWQDGEFYFDRADIEMLVRALRAPCG
jgi:hypothetical protein